MLLSCFDTDFASQKKLPKRPEILGFVVKLKEQEREASVGGGRLGDLYGGHIDLIFLSPFTISGSATVFLELFSQ